jgi:hypothetical protein
MLPEHDDPPTQDDVEDVGTNGLEKTLGILEGALKLQQDSSVSTVRNIDVRINIGIEPSFNFPATNTTYITFVVVQGATGRWPR